MEETLTVDIWREAEMFFVYALKCSDGSIYIGQTNCIESRLKRHRAGQVRWTASRLPVEMVYLEELATREEAVQREKYLKAGSGRDWLKKTIATSGR